ncbi:hypothetical protein GCM10020001_068650 [Nonomuraea salmonea]
MADTSDSVAVTSTESGSTSSMAAPVAATALRCRASAGPATRYCLFGGGSAVAPRACHAGQADQAEGGKQDD